MQLSVAHSVGDCVPHSLCCLHTAGCAEGHGTFVTATELTSALPTTPPDCASTNCTCSPCGDYFFNPFGKPPQDAKCYLMVTVGVLVRYGSGANDPTTCSSTLTESVVSATTAFLAGAGEFDDEYGYTDAPNMPPAVPGSVLARGDCELVVSGLLSMWEHHTHTHFIEMPVAAACACEGGAM